MKTLRLTESDYRTLIMMLGYSLGAHVKQNGPVPTSFGEVVDWILIQGNPDNYTYYNDKVRLVEKKELELKEKGK